MTYLVLGRDADRSGFRVVWEGSDPLNASYVAGDHARRTERGAFVLRVECDGPSGWPKIDQVEAVSYQAYHGHRYGDAYEDGSPLPPFAPREAEG